MFQRAICYLKLIHLCQETNYKILNNKKLKIMKMKKIYCKVIYHKLKKVNHKFISKLYK